MILTILVKTVYGNVRYYPKCKMSRLLLKLTGQKCFTKANVAVLKEVGFLIEFERFNEGEEI
jgi:hypothetical protein